MYKKILVTVISSILVLSFAGCGKSQAEKEKESKEKLLGKKLNN
ncbi:hypothetical protein [Acinetobacter pollinis]|nr:hypothetical protein [Acinetobacter pollinis]